MTWDDPVVLPEPSHAPTIRSLELAGGRRATAQIRQTALTELARTALLGIPKRPLLARGARLVQSVLDAGDAVLVATGERLRAALRPPDTVGRLGGDEFVAICEDIGGVAEVLAVAERLAASLDRSVPVAGRNVRLRASIGVALSTSDATEPAALLTEADGAMFWAKRSGVGIALFDERMRVGTVDVQPLETANYAAFDRYHWSSVPGPGTGAGGRLVARLVEVLESIDDPDRLDLRDPPTPGIQRP